MKTESKENHCLSWALSNAHLSKITFKLEHFLATDLDGKLYDAYVAYPQLCPSGCNEDVEAFAIHVLPQVLEKACGYKLFIAGRDCVPGQGRWPAWCNHYFRVSGLRYTKSQLA